MVNLPADQLILVREILQQQVPDYTVWAFGSRVSGKAKRFSDLDLAILGSGILPFNVLGNLREAFSESRLPIKIDVVDYQRVIPEFQRVIVQQHEVIQEPRESASKIPRPQ